MNARGGEVLYSGAMLALAVELANYPYDATLPVKGEARSRVCGSEIALACRLAPNGNIETIGLQVSACAVGQAAAAIFARSAGRKDRIAIKRAEGEVEAWLAGNGVLPEWPSIELLAPALPHQGRHQAILLPWRAALDALSSAIPPR